MLVQLPFYMQTEPNAETTDEKTASNNLKWTNMEPYLKM